MITQRRTLTITLHDRSCEWNSVQSGGSVCVFITAVPITKLFAGAAEGPVSTRRVAAAAAAATGITDASLQLALLLAQGYTILIKVSPALHFHTCIVYYASASRTYSTSIRCSRTPTRYVAQAQAQPETSPEKTKHQDVGELRPGCGPGAAPTAGGTDSGSVMKTTRKVRDCMGVWL